MMGSAQISSPELTAVPSFATVKRIKQFAFGRLGGQGAEEASPLADIPSELGRGEKIG